MTSGTWMSSNAADNRTAYGTDWSDLVDGLRGSQREAVISALQHSAATGWPPSREAVRALLDYALGRITSQEYAAQILVVLGYADAQTANALIARRPRLPAKAEPGPSPFDAGAGADFLL